MRQKRKPHSESTEKKLQSLDSLLWGAQLTQFIIHDRCCKDLEEDIKVNLRCYDELQTKLTINLRNATSAAAIFLPGHHKAGIAGGSQYAFLPLGSGQGVAGLDMDTVVNRLAVVITPDHGPPAVVYHLIF